MAQKIAVITGSSSGVGFATASLFEKNGFKVIGLSRSKAKDSKFETIETDLTIQSEIDRAYRYIQKEFGRVDVLINNAGRGMLGAVEDSDSEEITKLLKLNLYASIENIKHSLKFMKQRNEGTIINISSIAGPFGLPYRGLYCASKAALDVATAALRYELKKTNIQICSVRLGDVKTQIAKRRIQSSVSDFYKNEFLRVREKINLDVNNGIEKNVVAKKLLKIAHNRSRKLKQNYTIGSFDQRLSLLLHRFLPSSNFESLIMKYSKL